MLLKLGFLGILSFSSLVSASAVTFTAPAPTAPPLVPEGKLEARGFVDWWKSVIGKIEPGWASVTSEVGARATSVFGNLPAEASSIAASVEADIKSDFGNADKIASALLGAFTGLPDSGSNKFASAIADITSLAESFPLAVSTAVPIALPIGRQNGQLVKVSEAEIDCIGCFVKGDLDIKSHFPSLADVVDIIGNKKPAGGNAFGLTASLDGFQAHLNLSLKASKPMSANILTVPLVDSSILGQATLGAVRIGPSFGVDLVLSVEIATPVEFSWGFDITLGNLTLVLDAMDISKSSATGFKAPEFNPQKFLAEVGNTNVTISATLRPYVGLTFDVFEEVIGATLDMSVPKLNVEVAQVNGQNNGICHKLGFDVPLLGQILISPSVEFDINAGINLGVAPTKTKLFGTAFTIDPTCTASAPSKVKRNAYVQATQALPWKEGVAIQRRRRGAYAYQTMAPA